jgi:hypothetical protein
MAPAQPGFRCRRESDSSTQRNGCPPRPLTDGYDCPRVLHVFDGGPITIANEENADALFMQIEIVRFGVEQNILEETDEDSL